MQNEFEKQVQQKMEDLKLVPSEPVWQKVEMQIHKKKDRRFLLWIPFLVLLLGGGLWIGIDRYSNNVAFHDANAETQKQNSGTVPLKTVNETIRKNAGETIQDHNGTAIHNVFPNKNEVEIINSKRSFNNKPVTRKKSFSEINTSKENSVVEEEMISKKSETVTTEITAPDRIVQSSIEQKNSTDTVSKIIQAADTSNLTSVSKEKIEVNISKTDSVKHDTIAIEKPWIKRHAQSKWKYNLIVASGVSGLSHLNFFDGANSLSASPANNGGGSVTGGSQFYGSSPVKKGFAFSIGAIAKKELSKRISFSSGLQYNYYSNSIEVGDRVFQNRTIMDFSVAQYYSNTGSSLQPYCNQYHFISIPATFDWQLLKNFPLNFHAGLSLQYLIQTNALRFDYSTQSYFHNSKAFNRTEVFSDFSFTYSVSVKQKQLMFGTQLQYALSSLEKGNSANHLFAYGLKAQWQLSKK